MLFAALDQAVETLKGLLDERGVKITRIRSDEERTERLLDAQLCSGQEISLVASFRIYADRAEQVNIEPMLDLFWPRADRLFKECWGPPIHDEREMPPRMRKRVREARNREYPAAQLSVVRDPAYFGRPPPSFSPSERTAISSHLAELVDVMVRHATPTYSRYCDADTFAGALLSPATKGEFGLLPVRLGAILVASGKKLEFMAWRAEYEEKIETDSNLQPAALEKHKRHLQALASRASPH
jgi:hypothetical protein